MSDGAGDGRAALSAPSFLALAPHPRLSREQLRLLDVAVAEAGFTHAEFVETVVKALPGVSGVADLDTTRFDLLMDGFVTFGFRHPAVPLLSAAQLACLDAARRQLGWCGREYIRFLRDTTGLKQRWRISGGQFVGLLWALNDCGAGVARPRPGFVDRHLAGVLRRLVWQAEVSDHDFRDLMLKFGGTIRMRGLDERAYARVRARLTGLGITAPLPAPRVAGAPGMVTQPQANVIWRLWQDARTGRDASERALDVAIALMLGFPGGLDTLTRAGARSVMDRMKASLVEGLDLHADRPAGEGAGRDASAPL